MRSRAVALALTAVLVSCGMRETAPEVAQPQRTAVQSPTTQPEPAPTHPLATPLPTDPAAPSPTVTSAPAPATVDAATDPRALAALLTAAETAIRDPGVTGPALDEAAHAQQRAYRRLALRPRWRGAVIRLIPRRLRPAVRRNAQASTRLSSLVTPQTELPDWVIVPPAPARRLLRHYRRAAARHDLGWEYLAAINLVETRMGRIRGRSSAGAQGPMQFLPSTWAAYGEGDINDDGDAIMAAARYLAAHGAPGDMRGALWHYNHSDRYVDAVSAYAEVLREDPRAFRGYYRWQVYYVTADGDVHLPEGYGS